MPLLALLALATPALATPATAQKRDGTLRTVVMTAFPPEWAALEHSVANPKVRKLNGLTFLTGTMAGKPVLLMQSGVSMVNAAMNTQLVLDHFRVKRIIFSGIAGGVDPNLGIGDVVVPADWGQYLEVSFARKTADGWVTPEPVDTEAPSNFGMMFPRGVRLGNAIDPVKRHYTLGVDPALLALARKVAAGVYKLVDLLSETGLVGSKGEARRLIEQGGVKIDGEKATAASADISIDKQGVLFQVGKRRFLKLRSA